MLGEALIEIFVLLFVGCKGLYEVVSGGWASIQSSYHKKLQFLPCLSLSRITFTCNCGGVLYDVVVNEKEQLPSVGVELELSSLTVQV